MLKAISPKSTATVVWTQDPAVDQEKSDTVAYSKNVVKNPSCKSEFLKFNGQPTEFVIGVIPPSQLTEFEDSCGFGRAEQKRNKLHIMCFYRGLRDIRNYPEEWTSETGKVPMVDPGGGQPKFVDPVWLERNFSRENRQCALYVGGIIWAWNQYTEEEGKN